MNNEKAIAKFKRMRESGSFDGKHISKCPSGWAFRFAFCGEKVQLYFKKKEDALRCKEIVFDGICNGKKLSDIIPHEKRNTPFSDICTKYGITPDYIANIFGIENGTVRAWYNGHIPANASVVQIIDESLSHEFKTIRNDEEIRMIDNNLILAFSEANKYDSQDAYISDITTSSMWGDGSDLKKNSVIAQHLWDIYSRGIRCIVEYSGMSYRAFAISYGIPVRTMENWKAGINSPPVYALLLLAHDQGMI